VALLRRALRAILDQEYAGQITAAVVFDQSDPLPAQELLDDLDRLPSNRHLQVLANTQRNPGLAGARNTGILASDTELIAFCDDDDEWLPGKVQAQVELLRQAQAQGENVAVISCGFLVHYQGKDKPRIPGPQPLGFADFLRDRHLSAVHPCALMMLRERVVGEIGLVDEDLPGSYAEDYEWVLRASRVAPVRCVPKALMRAYWHSGSYYTNKWRTIREGLEHLLATYPEFETDRRGLARIEGQIAWASVGMGDKAHARAMARRTLGHHWKEKRAWLALVASTGLIKPDQVVALAHRTGRGI
jgi:glycosyltransferase involved in cell wall biosynthesis